MIYCHFPQTKFRVRNNTKQSGAGPGALDLGCKNNIYFQTQSTGLQRICSSMQLTISSSTKELIVELRKSGAPVSPVAFYTGGDVNIMEDYKYWECNLDWIKNTNVWKEELESSVFLEVAQVIQHLYNNAQDLLPVCSGQCRPLCHYMLGQQADCCGCQQTQQTDSQIMVGRQFSNKEKLSTATVTPQEGNKLQLLDVLTYLQPSTNLMSETVRVSSLVLKCINVSQC